MTEHQHRATPEQWASIDDPENPFAYEVCLLELRDRIAALEASAGIGQPVTPANTSAPTDSLVERVARAIYEAPHGVEGWRSEARAAIREVAAWLDIKGQHGCSLWLRDEIER
jgi:hypothetical protein